MPGSRIKKLLDLLIIPAIIGFLVFGALMMFFRPKSINLYENRTAYQVPAFSLAAFADSSFQDDMESALRDQVFLSGTMEAAYLQTDSAFQRRMCQSFLEEHPDIYSKLLGCYTFGGEHLVYYTKYLDSIQDVVDARLENINAAISAHPELTFYDYYIEKETDLSLETGVKSGVSDYVYNNLQLDENHKRIFRVDNFDELDSWFYKTDHHWNDLGSYRGYTDLLAMLQPDAEPLQPVGEGTLPTAFSGSKANTSGASGVFSEYFSYYVFDYPEMDVTINGEPAEDYGLQTQYISGAITDTPSYLLFYGSDNAETIFDTHQEQLGNILVIGESFDNAILKLLASHYHQTYSIDLRYYASQFGTDFSLGSYTAEHQIDTVLLIGNMEYYQLADFDLEG